MQMNVQSKFKYFIVDEFIVIHKMWSILNTKEREKYLHL